MGSGVNGKKVGEVGWRISRHTVVGKSCKLYLIQESMGSQWREARWREMGSRLEILRIRRAESLWRWRITDRGSNKGESYWDVCVAEEESYHVAWLEFESAGRWNLCRRRIASEQSRSASHRSIGQDFDASTVCDPAFVRAWTVNSRASRLFCNSPDGNICPMRVVHRKRSNRSQCTCYRTGNKNVAFGRNECVVNALHGARYK